MENLVLMYRKMHNILNVISILRFSNCTNFGHKVHFKISYEGIYCKTPDGYSIMISCMNQKLMLLLIVLLGNKTNKIIPNFIVYVENNVSQNGGVLCLLLCILTQETSKIKRQNRTIKTSNV